MYLIYLLNYVVFKKFLLLDLIYSNTFRNNAQLQGTRYQLV